MRTFRMSLAGAVVLAATAAAQTTTPSTPNTPTTTTTAFTTTACTTTTTSPLQSFSVEETLPLTGFNSSFTPTFPTGVQAAIQANTLEIRQAISYNAQNKLLTLNLFTVQTGAPVPTPTNAIPSNAPSLLSVLSIKVDTLYTSTGNRPSVMFVGTVATNSPSSPFGDLTGTPAALSVGYTGDTPAKINNVAVLIAGTVLQFAGTGTGAVTFTSTAVTPPGTSGAGPAIVVPTPGATTLRVVTLDASQTTGTDTPLTFKWSVVAGAADVANANAATATGYILGGSGIYTFRVTVTDNKGNVSTKDINVQFR